jgi:hypothetical protein
MRVQLRNIRSIKQLDEAKASYDTMADHMLDSYRFGDDPTSLIVMDDEVVFVVGIGDGRKAKDAISKAVKDFMKTEEGKQHAGGKAEAFGFKKAFDLVPYETWKKNGIKIMHAESFVEMDPEEDLR